MMHSNHQEGGGHTKLLNLQSSVLLLCLLLIQIYLDRTSAFATSASLSRQRAVQTLLLPQTQGLSKTGLALWTSSVCLPYRCYRRRELDGFILSLYANSDDASDNDSDNRSKDEDTTASESTEELPLEPVAVAAATTTTTTGESNAEALPSFMVETSLYEPSTISSRRVMDPLLTSLTRMDEATNSAQTIQIPVWGELILDRSLFVFLPVAAFAVLGFALSVYVALNSGDAIVDTLSQSTNDMFSSQPAPAIDDGSCRGICSSQDESLESLRAYMNRIAGKGRNDLGP